MSVSYPPHWSYYISLEDDLIETSRYVEICEDNFSTYSTQFIRLLLAAGSEVDVVAKMLCEQIDPTAKCRNIDDYRKIIVPARPAITQIVMGIQWNPVRVRPWASWEPPTDSSPNWWTAYNAVKHRRNADFKSGNLQNALEAIAGLYCLIRHLKEDAGQPKLARFLRIESSSEKT